MKKDKIIYWGSTLLIILLICIPAIMFNGAASVAGFNALGFPWYFRIEVGLGKILGGIILALPMLRGRLKEWAYVAFGIDFISAFIANTVVLGFGMGSVLAIIALVVLYVSYAYYRKLYARSSLL